MTEDASLVVQDNWEPPSRDPVPLDRGEAYAALIAANGNVAAASRVLGVTRTKLQTLIDRTPAFVALVAELRDEIIDHAEDNIYADVKRGDQTASRFVVQTIGKSRGWSTGVVGTGKDGSIVVEVRKLAEETPGG